VDWGRNPLGVLKFMKFVGVLLSWICVMGGKLRYLYLGDYLWMVFAISLMIHGKDLWMNKDLPGKCSF
jgi:hypothetical protein